ncbi:MAG: TolC family protein, partial [Flavobacteriales bacterium]|nr:TolC family protein [Flavobacteriales bacterium]
MLDSIKLQNHRVKQLEYNMASWQNQEIAAKKMGMPQFSIGIDYMYIGKSDNPDLGNENGRDALMLPKVGISIPLYRKKYTAMVNEATYQLQATEFKKEDQQNQLTSLFEKGYKDYSDGERRIGLFEKQLKLANKSLNLLLTAYSSDGENFE